MVKRYSVSVSDELAEKIDKWKKVISASQVFQDAMERIIADKEGYTSRLAENDESMDSIIERLRREKQIEEKTHYNSGKDIGFEWAKKASYRELRFVLDKRDELAKSKGKRGDKKADPDKSNFFRVIISNILKNDANWMGIAWKYKCESGALPAEAVQWLTGWMDGVDALWKEVKERL